MLDVAFVFCVSCCLLDLFWLDALDAFLLFLLLDIVFVVDSLLSMLRFLCSCFIAFARNRLNDDIDFLYAAVY